MNTTSTLNPWPTKMATGKGIFWPILAEVSIPAGLDADIKAKLTSVLTRINKGLYCTSSRQEDLVAIAAILGQEVRQQAYRVRLNQNEINALYDFLLEQAKWKDIYWPTVFDYELRDSVWDFLAYLKTLKAKMDGNTSRPIYSNG